MNEKTIRAKYAARKCETQIEFEHIMQDINEEQAHLNHPYIDREREIAVQRENIRIQIKALETQNSALKMEYIELDKKRMNINRIFHDLKHELIMMNPREDFARKDHEEGIQEAERREPGTMV